MYPGVKKTLAPPQKKKTIRKTTLTTPNLKTTFVFVVLCDHGYIRQGVGIDFSSVVVILLCRNLLYYLTLFLYTGCVLLLCMSLDTNVQKKKKKTTDKCVTSSSDVNESEKVQLDESIGDKSVTPESMISDSNGPETRLQSKISELKLKNLSLQEEC